MSSRSTERQRRDALVVSPPLFLLAALFILLSVGTAILCLSAIFPDYPPFPLPYLRISDNVGWLLFSLFYTLFLASMIMSTCTPIMEYVMKYHFKVDAGNGIALVRIWPAPKGLHLPTLSSSHLVRWMWYACCLAGLPLSLAGVLVVAFLEPDAISRGLYTVFYDFDSSLLVPMFLLIPAQQLGAGYLASGLRAVSSQACRADSDRALQAATRTALLAGLYNVGSLLILALWFLGLMHSFEQGGVLLPTLLLCLMFLFASVALYYYGAWREMKVARDFSADAPSIT